MRQAAGNTDFIDWARFPPAHGRRDPWERAICDCVERGDVRFVQILRMHIGQGVIRSDRAVKLLSADAHGSAA